MPASRAVVAGPIEATTLGNVMIQAIAAGYLPDVAAGRQAIARSTERHFYDPQSTPAWDDAYERLLRLL